MNIGYELLKMWVLWYASAAFVGAFLGTATVLFIKWSIKKGVQSWRKRTIKS